MRSRRKLHDISVLSKKQSGEDYLQAIQIGIPLEDIFKVVDSCISSQDGEYCSVLLKMGKHYDKGFPKQKIDHANRYQLQIWKKGGDKIFERLIYTDEEKAKPVLNWNMFDDVFVFQQSDSQLCMVQCFPNQNCRCFNFTLPQAKKIISPRSDENDNINPNHLIGYWNKYILFVTENKIYSFNVQQYLNKGDYKLEESVNEIPIHENLFYRTEISSDYYAVALIQAQDNMTCLVLASQKTNKLEFFKIKNIENDNKKRGEKKARGMIELTQMGNDKQEKQQEKKEQKKQTGNGVVKIKQFVSVVCKDSQNEVFQVAMSLLSDGKVHFYYNFARILNYNDQLKQGGLQEKFIPIKWIGTDLEFFFFLPDDDDETGEKQKKRLYRCSLVNKNRIGFQTAKKMESSETKKFTQHLKIKNHFKNFTAFMNFQVFVVIANRDRLIKIDLTNEREQAIVAQYQLDDEILDMSLVKNPKEKDQKYLMVTTKRNQLYVISKDFKKEDFDNPKELFGSDEQIIKCFIEREHLKAVLYLTQSASKEKSQLAKSMIQYGQNIFKNFDQFKVETKFNLYACSTDGKPYSLKEPIEFKPDLALFIDQSESDESDTKVRLMLDYQDVEDREKKTLLYKLLYQDQDDFSIQIVEEEQKFLLNQQLDNGKLIGVVCAWSKHYGKSKGFIARITSQNICVYSSAKNKHQFKFAISNVNIAKMLLLDEKNLYCLKERSEQKFMLQKPDKLPIECPGIYEQNRVAGVFYINMQRLIKDAKLELFQLTKCVLGVNDQFKLSDQDRISFVENFSCIQSLPLIHRNSINFLGMHPQDDYLIWREKNGFFTALQKDGELHTWSMLTGNHLFEKQIFDLDKNLEGFKIYKSSDKDDQYTRGYYNGLNSTIQLLIKDVPRSRKILSQVCFDDGQLKKSKANSTIFNPNQDGNQQVYIDAEIEYGEYEFKVLQLKMHQDFQDEDNYDQFTNEETVQELFNFTFNLSIKEKKEEEAESEETTSKSRKATIKPEDEKKYEPDGRLQLVLSQDTMRLMVIIQNDTFCIFDRPTDIELKDQSNKWNWRPDPDRQYIKFPSLLQGQMKANFLFDPTFTYFINCDLEREQFVVVTTDGKHYKDIPKGQISAQGSVQPIDSTVSNAKKMFFRDKNTLEYIKDNDLWVMLDIDEMKVKRYSRMKNRLVNATIKDKHSILNPANIPEQKVFKRILNQGQWADIQLERAKYKEEQYEQLKVLPKYLKKTFEKTLLSSLYEIDYNNTVNGELMFQANQSFTILDWLIQDEVLTNKNVKIENVDHNQSIQLCMNIFPCRKTVLHYFVDNCFKAQVESSVNNQDVVITLFQTCAKGVKQTKATQGVVQSIVPFEIPIIEDCYGQTPFDIALNIEKYKLSQLFKAKKENKQKDQEKQTGQVIGEKSEMMAAILFASTKDYKFLHSAHLISNAIIKAVEENVPGMGEYIEGRLKPPTINLPNLNQRPNMKKMKNVFIQLNDFGQRKETEYGAASMRVFSGKEEVEEKFFKSQEGTPKLMEILQLDIPHIFDPQNYNIQGVSFIQALNKTKEVDLFLLQSVQALINQHFESVYVKIYLWIAIIIPYLAQLALFITWSNFTLKKKFGEKNRTDLDLAIEAALGALCIWFGIVELSEIFVHKWHYFLNFWRILNIVPIILILHNILSYYLSEEQYLNDPFNEKIFWDIQAMAALALWGKFLYILRSFDQTGYLIRSLVEVTKDMWVFLVVLLIVTLGFGDAFGSLNLTQNYEKILAEERANAQNFDDEEKKSYIEKYDYFVKEQQHFGASIFYAFQHLKGEDNASYSEWMTVISVFCFVLLNIVMMNLLIAIVSATFERVTQSSIQYSCKEKVSLISDIYDVIGFFKKWCRGPNENTENLIKGAKTEFLFIVKQDQKNKEAIPEQAEEEDEISINDQVGNLTEEIKFMRSKIDEIDEKIQGQLEGRNEKRSDQHRKAKTVVKAERKKSLLSPGLGL